MNAPTINTLAALDPKARIPHISAASVNHIDGPLHSQARDQFLSNYVNVAFGWYIASQFAAARIGFPLPMMGRDTWVFKAFLMQVDPWAFYNKDIATAYHIAHTPKGSTDIGAKLRAMILSVNEPDPRRHMQRIAGLTGLSYETVEAFEVLFYNVLDRLADGFYLSSEVYPDTRLIELAESYMADSTLGDLLKRAGYNQRDLDLTTYLVGIGDKSYMSKIAAAANSEAELSNLIMSNGIVLAKANLLNIRSVGMGRASSLMVASRQSGTANEEPPLAGISSQWADAFKQATLLSQADVAQRMRKDAGQVVVLK